MSDNSALDAYLRQRKDALLDLFTNMGHDVDTPIEIGWADGETTTGRSLRDMVEGS